MHAREPILLIMAIFSTYPGQRNDVSRTFVFHFSPPNAVLKDLTVIKTCIKLTTINFPVHLPVTLWLQILRHCAIMPKSQTLN